MKKNIEVPGNVLATQAMVARVLEKTGQRVHLGMVALLRLEGEGLVVSRITFKPNAGLDGEWLAVITARSENAAIVAFHSGTGMVETVEGLYARLANGSLNWKEDEYAK